MQHRQQPDELIAPILPKELLDQRHVSTSTNPLRCCVVEANMLPCAPPQEGNVRFIHPVERGPPQVILGENLVVDTPPGLFARESDAKPVAKSM